VESWLINLNGPSGEDPRTLKPKLRLGLDFVSDTAKVLFPAYAATDAFVEKLRRTMMVLNAYSNELACWKHINQDYIALSHANLNVDNAYFWRDEGSNLDLGVFDWGGMGSMCLGHKLWWWLYCSDYAEFEENLPHYISIFVETYREFGGPSLDDGKLRMMVIITAMQQMLGLLAAVPQIMKMCKKEEWATIEDRYDSRISRNVDGKSTLRLYLHVMGSITRIIEEMGGDAVLQQWIESFWAGEFKLPPKSDQVIEEGGARIGL